MTAEATTGRPGRLTAWLREDLRRFDLVAAILTVGVAALITLGRPDKTDAGWPEVAAGVGAFVLVLTRRLRPMVSLTIALAWTAVHVVILGRPPAMIFAVFVLVATSCVRLERRQAIALGVGVATVLYVLALIVGRAEPGEDGTIIMIVWTALAVGVADAVRSWRDYRRSAEAQVRSTVAAAEAQARQQVSEERLTIARELHDLLAHNLSVMNVQTGVALHLLRTDVDQAEASLVTARDAGRSVLDELGELLSVLRHNQPTADGAPTSVGGAPTGSLPTFDRLDDLVTSLRTTNLAVNWTRSGSPRPLTPAASLAAYRIAQEALTNAAKHGSGEADLDTSWSDEGLTIRVSNSRSPQPADHEPGHGLIGMGERVALNGGRLSVGDEADQFSIEAFLPVDPGEPNS